LWIPCIRHLLWFSSPPNSLLQSSEAIKVLKCNGYRDYRVQLYVFGHFCTQLERKPSPDSAAVIALQKALAKLPFCISFQWWVEKCIRGSDTVSDGEVSFSCSLKQAVTQLITCYFRATPGSYLRTFKTSFFAVLSFFLRLAISYLLIVTVEFYCCIWSHSMSHKNIFGRTPLDKGSACRRDLYLTTHNIYKRQTSMPTAGIESVILANEWLQTHFF
jgi:hypothetical protein